MVTTFATMTTTKTTTRCRWRRRSSGDEKTFLKTKTKKTIGFLRRKRDDDDDDDERTFCKNYNNNNEEEEDAEKSLKKASVSLAAAAVVSACVADPAVAGFGAPTGAVLSPPVNTIKMKKLEKLNKQAQQRLSGMTTTGNIDILLLELNELQQLDTQELDDIDAERALLLANSVKTNLDTFSESEKAAEMNEQKTRLLNKRKEEAELVQRLVDRRVALGKLNNQTPLIVYGSALVASFLANTTMHPLDTMKVRRIALKSRRKIEERDSLDELDHGQQQQDQE